MDRRRESGLFSPAVSRPCSKITLQRKFSDDKCGNVQEGFTSAVESEHMVFLGASACLSVAWIELRSLATSSVLPTASETAQELSWFAHIRCVDLSLL